MSKLFVNDTEQEQEQECVEISGQAPDWLQGSLYRCGPAQYQLRHDFSVRHWFDGLGMICRISFTPGHRVFVQKRFVQSDAYIKANKYGKNVYTEFYSRAHPDPSRGVISRFISSILPTDMTDNTFHNVYVLNGRLFTAGETSLIYNIDPLTLKTGKKVDLNSCLKVNLCSSHPVQDTDGSYYTMGVSFFPTFSYQINRIAENNQAMSADQAFTRNNVLMSKYSASLGSYSYYHTFALTKNYCIIMEMPLLVILSKIMTMVVKGKSIRDCIEWQPERKVRFHVARKSDGRLIDTEYITDEPFFQAHMINSFETGGHIVIDMITYRDSSIFDAFELEKLRADLVDTKCKARISRIVIPVNIENSNYTNDENMVGIPGIKASAKLEGNKIVLFPDHYHPDVCMDFPNINPTRRFERHRFVFLSGVLDQNLLRNSVGRLDMEQRDWTCWSAGDDNYPSEVVFVPRNSNGAKQRNEAEVRLEDDELDGVLLTTVTCVSKANDYVAILDPRTMNATAKIPFCIKIPYLLHGLWLPAEEVEKISRISD